MPRQFVLALIAAGGAIAAVPSLFVAGQPAKAEEVNKNFSYLDSAVGTKASQSGVGTLEVAVTGLKATKADQTALEDALKLVASKVGTPDLEKALKAKADQTALDAAVQTIASKVGSADLQTALKGKADTAALRALADLVAKKVDPDQLNAVKTSVGAKADTLAVNSLKSSLAQKADVAWVNTQIAASAPSGMLASGKNLSDLTDKVAARTNLGLGALATKGSLAAGDVGALALSGGAVSGLLQASGFANIGVSNPPWAPSAATPLTVSGNDWVTAIVQTTVEGKGATWGMATPSNSNSFWVVQKRDDGASGTNPGGFAIEDGFAKWGVPARFPLSIAAGEGANISLNRNVVVTGASGQYPTFDKYAVNVSGSVLLQNMTGQAGNLALEFKGGPNYQSGSMDLVGVSNSGDMTDSLRIVNASGATLFSIANATGNAFFAGTITGNLKGSVVATDIKASNVADYVFEPEYKLASLSEVEAYTKTHKHLPEVPSAAEIEANGLDLARMNLVLLKKVEELTLHTIELEKRMKAMETASQAR